MKTMKIVGRSRVSRNLISRFGEAVYSCDDVKSILIMVNFKDGFAIKFRKDEEEDEFEDMMDKRHEE